MTAPPAAAMWRTLLVLVLAAPTLLAQESSCCAKASGSCRQACEQISLVAVAANTTKLEMGVEELQQFCPLQMANFWNCMNETIQDLERGAGWSGRHCCSLGVLARCKVACARASDNTPLALSCRRSDEIDLFACVERNEAGDECCSSAHSPECRSACSAVFRNNRTPSRAEREAVLEACSEGSPRVLQCVKNHTNLTPAHNTDKYLHCCEKSGSVQCRDSCRLALRTRTTHHEIVDALQDGGCGPMMYVGSDRIWSCLLQNSNEPSTAATRAHSAEASRIERTGIDGAKMHCCNQARSSSCRRDCHKTFSNDWDRLHEAFDHKCLANPHEARLARCITEVEEPCELGCSGLNYCTNFNQRPTQLFRSCTDHADTAARYDFALWQSQGFIQLPNLTLPVRNITECRPEAWKALACSLQTRPCNPQLHTSNICTEDCLELLNECADKSRLPEGASMAALCQILSPENAPCLPLSHFQKPSDWASESVDAQVTAPCRGDPCSESEVCTVNRNCPFGSICPQHSCSKGCKMGEVSKLVVPQGTYMRIPILSTKNCFKICQCSARGAAENCVQLPCYTPEGCILGSRKYNHGDSFYVECNMCSCFAGEITCSKKYCETHPEFGMQLISHLPCKCPLLHRPVCGRNGNTYPSACLAKCVGLQEADFMFGPCSSKDPCDPNPCGDGRRCVPSRQVCLSLMPKSCPQHICADVRSACNNMPFDPVCDSDNQEHPNLCFLVRYNKRMAYKGKCLANCHWLGIVCGVDGQNYLSECAALAARVAVDYEGPCVAIGTALASPTPQCGSAVRCAPLPVNGCVAATPPGACCPVCGGALRALVSAKWTAKAAYKASAATTVTAVLTALERLVPTAECRLLGHLTIEADLWITVKPVPPYPTPIQLAACVDEAEKLAALVQTGNPRLAAVLPLSLLTAATTVHSPVERSAGSVVSSPIFVLIVLPTVFGWNIIL